jgi:hypothetical protein
MSASAAATGVARAQLERSAFCLADFSTQVAPNCDGNGRVWQVKQVLRQAGLTMSRVSALTGMRYGQRSSFFVPPTFLYKQKNGITPHICQLVALSQVTGYRFADWMNVWGFDLNLILALQLRVHNERTAIVTPARTVVARDVSRLLRTSRLDTSGRRYFFAKIGSCDNVVYPKLLPGSMVRADRCYSPDIRNAAPAEDLLWLVEHPGGVACCHVKRIDNEHIVLLPNRPPLSAWPLRLSREARILGLIDLELRPRDAHQFEPTYLPVKSATLPMVPHGRSQMTLSRLLRVSRSRAGLTLRAAHKMTLRVAQLLRNRDYGIPLGLLSDYEAMNRFPRHIAKIMSLCIIYGIDFWELMEAGGSHIDDSDKMPILAPAPWCSSNFGTGTTDFTELCERFGARR